MKIGFIGLGIMGSRMAINLQKSGHEMILYNRTASKGDLLVERGALMVNSPKEVVEKSEVIFTMLEAPAAVEAVALDEQGILTAEGTNKLWVDCSTVHPSFTKSIAQSALRKGFRFLEAPVAGSKGPAESGELVFFVGGEESDMASIQPLLDIMGKKSIRIGEHGQAAAMKLVVNLLLAQSMLAFSESMVLGDALGVDRKLLMDVVLNTPVTAPFLSAIRPKLDAADETPNFPLRLIRKDLQLVSEAAYENGISMPSAGLAKEIYTQAMSNGLGESDFSAIYKYLGN